MPLMVADTVNLEDELDSVNESGLVFDDDDGSKI